jgi:hypothetical protein
MKIRFLTGPRAGQIDHSRNSQEAELLVKAGIIEVIPYKNFQERLAAESPKPAAAPVVSWGVHHNQTENSIASRVTVSKTVNGETTIYSAPPKDCPADVIVKFRKADALYEQMIQDARHARQVQQGK